MKTVRIYGLLMCLLFAAGASAESGVSAGNEPAGKRPIKDGMRKDISAFFARRLAGEEADFEGGKSLKRSEVAVYRDEVWRLWKAANEGFAEEKLPPLDSLSEAAVGRWSLPDSLEPHAVMPYYWGRKGNGEAVEDGLPMFLYLHGSGPKRAEWAAGLKICRMFDDSPSVYFIPQIPNEGAYYRWWQKAKQFAWEKLLRLSMLDEAIDPDRIYVFGISEGGYGSQRLASFYADYWAGAGPMAGGEPLRNAPPENCANIAFSLRTGAKDFGFYRNLLTGYTGMAMDSLGVAHPGCYAHRIELIPNMEHGIDYRPTTPWLRRYVRNPYPKYVSWENFEMDGRYRKGFYNLAVRERPNDDENSRSYYEMRVSGNDISLRVDEVVYETTKKDPNWGIELRFVKRYEPARKGKLTVYLCDELVDLSRKVTLTVNGKKVFEGKVKPNLRNMVNSCALFFDPRRVYPAAIEVDLAED